MKLPKQWNRWTKKAGLKSDQKSSLDREYTRYYFKGHGRNWRLNCHGWFDVSVPEKDFDRWALSRADTEEMCCKNEKEFVELVQQLLKRQEEKVKCGH